MNFLKYLFRNVRWYDTAAFALWVSVMIVSFTTNNMTNGYLFWPLFVGALFFSYMPPVLGRAYVQYKLEQERQ